MITSNDPNNQLPNEMSLHFMNYKFLNTYEMPVLPKTLDFLALTYLNLSSV